MIWIAGGVGITPFLAMYEALKEAKVSVSHVQLFYSCRGNEAALVSHMTDLGKLAVFDSSAPQASGFMVNRRLQEPDLGNVSDRNVYLCGPEQFMKVISQWMGSNAKKLITEKFTF